MQKPKESRILPREKIYAGLERGFRNNVSMRPTKLNHLLKARLTGSGLVHQRQEISTCLEQQGRLVYWQVEQIIPSKRKEKE